jgi:hypothetical protein
VNKRFTFKYNVHILIGPHAHPNSREAATVGHRSRYLALDPVFAGRGQSCWTQWGARWVTLKTNEKSKCPDLCGEEYRVSVTGSEELSRRASLKIVPKKVLNACGIVC